MVMSNIEELRRRLLAEAEKKAEEIIEEAKKKAEEIIKNAEETWRKKAEEKKNEILKEANRRARIIVSEAKRKARLIISSKKYELLEKIFNEAWTRINERREFDIAESLRKLLEESLQYIEEPKIIYVNPRDREVIGNILNKKELRGIEIREEPRISGGLILVSSRGEKIDNSYDTRFNRAKRVLAPLIAKMIWG
jgi:V/A-type H+-transporting ATPase subunit E